jgi:hypothetical protein
MVASGNLESDRCPFWEGEITDVCNETQLTEIVACAWQGVRTKIQFMVN